MVLMIVMVVSVGFRRMSVVALVFWSLGPSVPWSLFFRYHVNFDRRQSAAAHFAHLQSRAHIQGHRRLGKQLEGHACIHKRAQQHVSADPGKALQIADSHRFVILTCFRPEKGGEKALYTPPRQHFGGQYCIH
jgi:hypothetical protein